MKKFAFIVAAFVAISTAAHAQGINQAGLSTSTITTNQGVDSASVRGIIEGITVVIPTAKTATVTIATAEGVTVFTKADITAGTTYHPIRVPVQTTAGATITWITGQAALANAATNIVYDRVATVGPLTLTVAPAANTTGTNTYSAFITYSK
jgi:hypothetical protein